MMTFLTRIRDILLGAPAWRELTGIDRGDRTFTDAVARDLAVARSDLVALAATGSRHMALRDRMMAALGIRPQAVPASAAPWLRDTAIVCGRCRFKWRCARELRAGTAAQNAARFCPNAAAFEELREAA